MKIDDLLDVLPDYTSLKVNVWCQTKAGALNREILSGTVHELTDYLVSNDVLEYDVFFMYVLGEDKLFLNVKRSEL